LRGAIGVNKRRDSLVFILFLSLFPIIFISEAVAQEPKEKDALLMYFTDEDIQVVSATRSLKPISHAAENMTVVTAADIERMNAHSLAEVLDTVTGVQVYHTPRTPGNSAQVTIQGAWPQYVTIMIDGVIINQLSNNITDIGIIPVQHIERIEIIKGPASSSWGSALGGIINVITKGPPDKGVAGMASVSYGSNHTEDYRAEIRGRTGDFGMYLSAGGIHSKGFGLSSDVMKNHVYSKLAYSITPGTDLRMSLFYLKSGRGLGYFTYGDPLFDEKDRDKNEQYFGTVSLSSRISNEITLDVYGSAKREDWTGTYDFYRLGAFFEYHTDERRYGAGSRVTYKQGAHTVVAGAEYDYGVEKAAGLIDGKQSFTKVGFFVNDTISVGDFSVTPGMRYDNTNIGGDFASPSLGVTYQPTKKTVLRVNVARGYYAPTLLDKYRVEAPNYGLKVTHVWSYQAGAETSELKYVWLKASVFRHDVKDVIDCNYTALGCQSANRGSVRMQGVEAEMKTMTFFNAWVSAGATFVDSWNLTANQDIKLAPRYAYDLALNYDDRKSLRAMFRGRYVWWNQYSWSNGQYSSFIFDVSASKKICTYDRHSFEIFAAAHNIFNDKQYYADFYKNPRRWAEIGVRYKF
jgi:vitamin B12 transporter